MNIKLAKEIYANAWFIDPLTFMQLNKTLELIKSGSITHEGEEKANSFGILDESQIFSAGRIQRMENVPQGSIAQYNFDSVITKGGGMSHNGTVEIANQFREMEANENVIGHIFKIESGGGSANAIKFIRDVSAKTNRSKPLVTFAEDVMASAAMYIASDSDYIFANCPEAIVGSIGTMIQMDGYKNESEDGNGKRHVRIYATQSVNKNKEFENAINDYNYELVRSKILDPHASQFIKDMETNRPNMTAIQKTGEIFRAEDAVGTLIDEIGTFEMAVNKVKELANINTANKLHGGAINNTKMGKMRKEEFKAANPTAYAEIVAEGTAIEKDRVEAWAVFNEVDPAKVKAGIESGAPLSAKSMAEFSLQMASGQKLEAIEDENAEATDTSKEVKTEAQIQAEADQKALDTELGEIKTY